MVSFIRGNWTKPMSEQPQRMRRHECILSSWTTSWAYSYTSQVFLTHLSSLWASLLELLWTQHNYGGRACRLLRSCHHGHQGCCCCCLWGWHIGVDKYCWWWCLRGDVRCWRFGWTDSCSRDQRRYRFERCQGQCTNNNKVGSQVESFAWLFTTNMGRKCMELATKASYFTWNFKDISRAQEPGVVVVVPKQDPGLNQMHVSGSY